MTLVKICGITQETDLIAAIEAGADFVGFVFHPTSPRSVTPEQVKEFTRLIRGLEVDRVPLCVGVFVATHAAPSYVAQILSECGLQAAQVHHLTPDTVSDYAIATDGNWIPAVQPRTDNEVTALMQALDGAPIPPPWLPQLLVDAYHPELAGGTGQLADLDLAAGLNAGLERMMLAGGLTPTNVGEVIRRVRPYAVDVSSGVERERGLKDHALLRAFIAAARAFGDEATAHLDEELSDDSSTNQN